MRVLITSGGTEEPIDGVRYITNFSTGRTGATLAERLNQLGARVLLLHGHRAALPVKEIETDSFITFNDLDRKLKTYIGSGEFDFVIHAAAVSDFSVDYMETENGKIIQAPGSGKLSSENSFTIHLKKNYKIISRLKNYAPEGKTLIVIGFKLTDTDSEEMMKQDVVKVLKSGKVDYLVQNNLRDITGNRHPAKIFSADGRILFETETKKEMAEKLFSLLEGGL